MAEDQWTDNEWMGKLRMSKVTFQKLCEELAPFIERRDMNYHKAISLRERVAITLYRLADTGPVIAQCQISLAWENEQFAKSCSRYVPALLKFCSRDLFTCPLLDKTLKRKSRLSSCVRAFPRLKEKVTLEIVFFLPSPIKILYGVKLITEVLASKVHAIPRN